MADVVYLLGAGFNCSVMQPPYTHAQPPLATNFFSAFLGSARHKRLLEEVISSRLYVDELFTYIQHYWKLSAQQLEVVPFDLEECMTLIQLQMMESTDDDLVRLKRIEFALLGIILEYLQDLEFESMSSPPLDAFGRDVWSRRGDVLTMNYDNVAERAIASASGFGQYAPNRSDTDRVSVTDEEIGDSHLQWKPGLAYGFKFDEVVLPRAGVSTYVSGDRYYKHTGHELYSASRVLKLHGSIDWLRYTGLSRYPEEIHREVSPGEPPSGICLGNDRWSWGEPPSRGAWRMEPVVIPPQLHKRYSEFPFTDIWHQARDTLRNCQTLIVVGYSFPPTDFAVRRLLLEAFADQSPASLVVVNPDTSVVELVRRLTHFDGGIVVANDLCSLYGVPHSYFDLIPKQREPREPDRTSG